MGLRAANRAKWMVAIFFACNLLLAAVVAAPMYNAISEHLGHSATANDLVRGFSSAWLTEFQLAYSSFLHSLTTSIRWAALLFLALNVLLSAGAFEVFAGADDDETARSFGWGMHAFGRGMGKFFFRFARLAVIASFFYYVAFVFWNVLMGRLTERIFANAVVARWEFDVNWLRWILLFITLFIINAIVEYAKADLVVHDHFSVLSALGHAAGFVLAHFRRVMHIYFAVGFLTALTILAYSVFARYMPQNTVATIVIWFAVAQLLFFYRWMFRISSWGATVAYYRAHAPARAAVAGGAATPIVAEAGAGSLGV
jgi:hypothetical protein